jgi:PilZ domain
VIFKSLFGGCTPRIAQEKLPQVHAFVDVSVGGRPMRSVSVEDVGAKEIVASTVLGRVGETATFVYTNATGKYRFATKIVSVADGSTHFDLPNRVDAVGGGAQKRSSVRMDVLVQGSWRFAPGGKGVGEFMKGSLNDISRGGCALITDRPFKNGQQVEVRMNLRPDEPPLTVLGEVMRSQQIPTSGRYSHGLKFMGMRPEEDHIILEFINRRQTELRNRGLA